MEAADSQQVIHIDNLHNEFQPNPQVPNNQDQSVSFCELYRFAQKKDYFFMFIGTFFALAGGVSLPGLAYLWGKIVDAFIKIDFASRLDNAIYYRNMLFYLGCAALGTFLFSFAFWTLVAERLAVKCRKAYMKGLLKQNLQWFEKNSKEGGLQKFNKDALTFQKAIGDKIRNMLFIISMFLCGIGIAVASRWKLALVLTAVLCIGAIFIAIYSYFINKRDQHLNENNEADQSGRQSITSIIKTVKILNGQQFQEDKYRKILTKLSDNAFKWIILAGIATGLFFFSQYGIFSFGFWFGTQCVGGTYICPVTGSDKIYTPGEVTAVFFAIFIGLYNLLQFGSTKTAIGEGMKAAKRLYKIIDTQSEERNPDGTIKSIPVGSIISGLQLLKSQGKIDKIGKIRFQNVSFAYPYSKQKLELNKLSFQIDLNGITALVGQVGCGKLAIIELIMRFYQPDEGKITINGNDIQKYDLQYLRSHIGYIGKTPSIFSATIRENMLIGKRDATDEEIRGALQQAQILKKIEQIGIDTKIGKGGFHLKESDKIRLCLARALIQKPSILILDEVTYSLDRQGEKEIQLTLDKISAYITTITIPHRIKNIRNANKIILLQSGRVLENGSFESIQRFKSLDLKVFQSRITNIVEEQEIRVSVDREGSVLSEYQTDKIKQFKGSIILRILSQTEGHRCKLFIGILCCILAGAGPTGLAILLAKVVYKQIIIYLFTTFAPTLTDISTQISDSQEFSRGVFYLGIFIFFPYLIKTILFTLLGETVSQNLKVKIFSKLIKLPINWFQKAQNKREGIATRFGNDSKQAAKILSELIPTYIINISCVIAGITLTFIAVWKMGLVSLITFPCIVVVGYILMRFYGDQASKVDRGTYEESNFVTQEACQNIQTIYCYNYQNRFQQKFNEKLQGIQNRSFCKGLGLGFIYGLAHAILSFAMASTYYWANRFMQDNNQSDPLNSIYACMTIIWPAWYAAHNCYALAHSQNWKRAAANLFNILDQKDEDQLQIIHNSELSTEPIEGNIQFKNVVFRYNPKEKPVLNKVSFTIAKGQKVAFFGQKGCGKSAIIQLLQGFYDFEGQILIDGKQIRQYDIHHLRRSLIGVSQDSYFFKGSIIDNIKYNFIQATQQEINEAATQAKAIDFITEKKQCPLLSDSQKQRIAITRVLIRQPQVLMLDQATTALDGPTEKRLHDSIDFKREGRTTLVVAHRTQAVMNSDRIYVLDKGKILEEGTYAELKQKKGLFNNLDMGKTWGSKIYT